MALELWKVAKGINIDDKVHLVHGTDNPTTVGFDAPISSIYFNENTGDLYIKIGALDTDWKYSATISDSSDIDNASSVLGATVTDALNTIQGHMDDVSIHRELDDAQTTSTNLWSAEKITQEITQKAGDVRSITTTLYHDSNSTINIGDQIPANAMVTEVAVGVKTPFNGTNVSFEVGTSLDVDGLAIADDIDLELEGTYTCDAGLVQYDSLTQIIGTYNRGSSTQGIAVILVKYVTATEVGSLSSSSSSSSTSL